MRLQDPGHTRIIIVSVNAELSLAEPDQPAADPERAHIHRWAWAVNNTPSAAAPTSPLLVRRANNEAEHLKRVRAIAPRVAVVPLQTREPIGVPALEDLARPQEVLAAR